MSVVSRLRRRPVNAGWDTHPDAVQEQGTAGIHVLPDAKGREAMGEGDSEHEVASGSRREEGSTQDEQEGRQAMKKGKKKGGKKC